MRDAGRKKQAIHRLRAVHRCLKTKNRSQEKDSCTKRLVSGEDPLPPGQLHSRTDGPVFYTHFLMFTFCCIGPVRPWIELLFKLVVGKRWVSHLERRTHLLSMSTKGREEERPCKGLDQGLEWEGRRPGFIFGFSMAWSLLLPGFPHRVWLDVPEGPFYPESSAATF